MKYQVPQFIETEDKIFGPLTLKQFLYVAGGAALGFIVWSLLPKPFNILFGIVILLAFLAMAFLKVNDRPMIFAVESGLRYFLGTKLYIWEKKERKPTQKADDLIKKTSSAEQIEASIPKLSNSKLKELTWALDINERLDDSTQNIGEEMEK